jgi:hypothetical protein
MLQSKAFRNVPIGEIMTTPFDTWLAKQFEDGLADIKFAVVSGKGVSVEAIEKEVLAADAAIAMGYATAAPKATSMLPVQVAKFVELH